MATPGADYRESHKNKGDRYHRRMVRGQAGMLWSVERRILDAVVSTHPNRAQLSHLDFACGTGRILNYLESRTRLSIGVDVSSSMLAVARANATRAAVVQADITRGAVFAESFDLITAFRFFPNAERGLRKEVIEVLSSLLAPNGWIVLNNHKNDSSSTHRLFGIPKNTMRHTEVLALADLGGLRVRSIHHAGVVPVPAGIPGFPYAMLGTVESWASRRDCLRFLASDLVYVLERQRESTSVAV